KPLGEVLIGHSVELERARLQIRIDIVVALVKLLIGDLDDLNAELTIKQRLVRVPDARGRLSLSGMPINPPAPAALEGSRNRIAAFNRAAHKLHDAVSRDFEIDLHLWPPLPTSPGLCQ